jgi:hypothetical protein
VNRKSEQYRFALIEGYRITLMCLEKQFKDSAVNLDKMETAVIQQLATENLCAPWRRSETEREGCREGMRLAAIESFRSIVRLYGISDRTARYSY